MGKTKQLFVENLIKKSFIEFKIHDNRNTIAQALFPIQWQT
jgi:hypothetical protein